LFVWVLALGRKVFALPLPVLDTGKIVLSVAGMAAAAHFIGSLGGGENLLFFALAVAFGAAVYGVLAVAMNVAGIRDAALKLARARG